MKILKLLLGLLFISLSISWKSTNPNCKNSIYILSQVIDQYDVNDQWQKSEIKVHIQEPRVGNPQRHTKLYLNNSDDYFEMERYREDGIVKRILTSTGESTIYLDGKDDLSEAIVKEYKLNVQRSINHKKFYKLMYGLPMTITDNFWKQIEPAQKALYEGIEVYKIRIELQEKMISNFWTLIIGTENYELLAIEFNHPEEPNKEEEIIKFEGEIEVNKIKIPRIRNWYIKGTNEYLGTDIIVNELK